MNKTYTMAEIEAMQQKPVSATLWDEKDKYIFQQKAVIRQLLSQVQEYQEVVERLRGCEIFHGKNKLNYGFRWLEDMKELDPTLWTVRLKYEERVISGFPAALKELTKG